jgi:ribosome-binding factor A
LTNASGFIRGSLGKTLNLRYIPVLEFILDETAEHVAKINKIINEFHSE